MKNTHKSHWALLASSCAVLATSNLSNAAIIVTFQEIGDDVIATWSGSFAPGTFFDDDTFPSASDRTGSDRRLFSVVPGSVDRWSGKASLTSLNSDPDSATGGNYGYSAQLFLYDGVDNTPDAADSPTVTFDPAIHTMTWSDKSLADIGAANFNNTLAWSSDAGGTNTISLTTVVPEPSSTILLGLGSLGMLIRRKR